MNIKEEVERYINKIDAFKNSEPDLSDGKYQGFQKLFKDPFFLDFLNTSPLVIAIYNFPLKKYDFISTSVSDVCFLSPKDFMTENGAQGFIEAMDENGREAMIETIMPLMMQTCMQYPADIKKLRFTACVPVYKTKDIKHWVLLHSYILEATPDGFPYLSCTLAHDVSEIKKDDLIYYSGKMLKDSDQIILYKNTLPETIPDLSLSNREIEVLKHICKGKTSKEIAEELQISFNTIKKHRNNILQKTGVSNTPQLINKATLMGIL